MKPPPFAYVAPHTLADVLDTLAQHGDDAKVLAGGQSLVPALNFRLARPEVVVDINRLQDDLGTLTVQDGTLRVGALVRHQQLVEPPDATLAGDPLGALLRRVGHHVGHLPIRLRGTLAGSLAHADPAAEWCACAVALDAEVHVASARGSRVVAATDLFDAPFMTTLEPDELITEVRVGLLGAATGVGFAELARTAGDFAIVAAVAAVELDSDGARADGGSADGGSAAAATIRRARIGLAGVAGRPVRAHDAEAALAGQRPTPRLLADAAAAAGDAVDPSGDLHASAEYRRHLVRALTRRALAEATAHHPRQHGPGQGAAV